MSGTGEVLARFSLQAGETLIEALVVVALTAMVALIGFPRMQQSLVGLAQRQTVAVVAARLREARAQAMRHDTPAVFALSSDGRSYGTLGGPVNDAPSGVSLAVPRGSERRIAFYGDGSSTGGVVWVRSGQHAIGVYVTTPAGAIAVGPG